VPALEEHNRKYVVTHLKKWLDDPRGPVEWNTLLKWCSDSNKIFTLLHDAMKLETGFLTLLNGALKLETSILDDVLAIVKPVRYSQLLLTHFLGS